MKKNKFNYIILLLCGIFFAANVSAQNLTGVRVFIDPGHDGFTSGDRWQATIPYGNQEHAGFWESRVNVVKGLALRDFLQAAGASVGISRTTTPQTVSLSARATASNTFNARFFVSIHSDAGGDPDTNHIVLLQRAIAHGGVNATQHANSRRMAQHLWPTMIQNQVTVWGAHNVPHGVGALNLREQSLGVLNGLTNGGVLTEGSFHDYGPERHRLLSATYARMEAYNIFRGICTFFQATEGTNSALNTFTTGAIIGWVKDNTRRMSGPGIPNASRFLPYRNEARQNASSTTNDIWVPINGAKIELLNMAGNVLHTYTVDNYWNGIFGFFNIPVGNYQLRMSAPGFQTRTENVSVTAGGLTNARHFLVPGTDGTPNLTLVLGTSVNAPFTPLIPAPHSIRVGDIAYLGAQEQGKPEWLNRFDLTLTSSNTSVATISADGTVKGVGIGRTDIRAVRNSDGATAEFTLSVTPGDLTHNHPFTSNGRLILRATEWTQGGTASNPTLLTLPLGNATAALLFMADSNTPGTFANISGQWANLTVDWYPRDMLGSISQWGTIVTTGVNTNGLVTIFFRHNDGREGLITLPVGTGPSLTPPAFEMLLGKTATAPHAPLLSTPFVVEEGDLVYLGIRTGGSTWENLSGFTLSSSHPAVATISPAGLVTAIAPGATVLKAVRNADNATVTITLTVNEAEEIPEPYRYEFYYHGSTDASWLNQNNIRRVIHHDGKLFVLSGVPTGHAQSTAMPTIGVYDAVTLEHLFNMATPENVIVSSGARRRINDIAMTEDGKLLAVNRAIVSSTARTVPDGSGGAQNSASLRNDQNFRVYIWDNLDASTQPRLFYTLNRNGLAHTGTQANPDAAAYTAAGNVHESLSAAHRTALLNNYGIAWNWSSLLGETFTVSGTSQDATIYMPVFLVMVDQPGATLSGDWRMAAHRVVNGNLVRTHWKNFRVTHDAASTLFGFTGATHTATGEPGFQISMSPLGKDRFIFTRNDGGISALNFPLEYRWDWNVTTILATNNAAPALTGSLDASHSIPRTTGISFFTKNNRNYMAAPVFAARTNAGVTLFDITDGLNNAVKISEQYFGSMSGTAANKMKAFGVVENNEIYLSLLAENQGLALFATYQQATTPTYTVNIQSPTNGTITVMDGSSPVSDGDVLEEGTTLTLTATPNENYIFVEWWDGDTNLIREVVLNSDLTISASFKLDITSIQNVPDENMLRVFPNPVENILSINADFEITSLRLVDLTGRTLINLSGNYRSIDMSGISAGNYILFVNDIPTRVVKR